MWKKDDTRFTRITRFSGYSYSSIREIRERQKRALYATGDIVDRFFVNNLVDAMSTWCTAGILFNLLSPKVLVISRARSPRRALLPAELPLTPRVSLDASSDGVMVSDLERPILKRAIRELFVAHQSTFKQSNMFRSRTNVGRRFFAQHRTVFVTFLYRPSSVIVPVHRECRSRLRENGFVAFFLSNYAVNETGY